MGGIDLSGLNDGQRRIATSLDVPLFVEAGAGSGKTFTLTQRIAWALTPGSGPHGTAFLDCLDQALVITFTEAAAREIRERVRSTLWRAGMREAASAVDTAWISTIHGMCARIVRRHALDLDIDPDFTVCQPHVAATMLNEAVDAVVRSARRDPSDARVMDRLIDEFGYAATMGRIVMLAEHARRAGGFDRLVLPPAGALPGAMARLLLACESLAAAHGLTPKAAATLAPTLEALRGFEALPPGDRDVGRVASVLDACALPRSSKAIAELLPDARVALAEARALVALESVRELAPALLAMAERTDERYAALKRTRSTLDYDDLVSLALRLVEGSGKAAHAYATRFRMVMVDEFQDTDDRQLRLISRLAGDGARHLATVGDAQQSIYRFRGADVGVFVSRGRELPPERHVRLATNYRSHRDVLAFVERVCGGTDGVLDGYMHLDDNPSRGDGYRAQNLPRVSVELASGPCAMGGRASRQQTATLAAQTADRLAAYRDAGHRAGDMALLLGVTTNAALYVDALRARGLECVVTGGSTFTSAPEVAVVCALLHALANPNDTRSGLFPLLSSEMFGLDADDFIQLGTRAQETLDAPTKRNIAVGLESMEFFHDAKPSKRLARASEVVGRALDRLAHMPLADVCLAAIRESGWLGRLEEEGTDGLAREANVLAAIRYVRELTSDLGLGPARAADEFDRWLELSKIPPASLAGAKADVVRVMTIHASKGLEFPVVAVAECWGNARATTGVLAGPSGDGATAIVLCPAKGVKTDGIEVGNVPTNLAEWHRALRERELAGDAQESARKLYVGLTRAREALVVALMCPLSKQGHSYHLAGDVAFALFGPELPPVGTSQVAYGGTCPASVRHVTVAKDGAVLGFTGAGDDMVPLGVDDVCLGSSAVQATASDGDGEAGFALFEADDGVGMPPIAQAPARSGVFSYTSVHASMVESHTQATRTVTGDGGIPPAPAVNAAAARASSDVPDNSSTPPKLVVPTRSEREAAASGAPATDDADRATNLGSAFHELAQAMVESQRDVTDEQIVAMADQWRLSTRQRLRLASALERWKGSDIRREALGYGRLRSEVPFFLQVGDSPYGSYVEGAIDLLCDESDATKALVVDYKTGDVGLSMDEAHARHEMQASFYAQVLMRMGYEEVECAFVCVEVDDGHGQPLVIRYTFNSRDAHPAPW